MLPLPPLYPITDASAPEPLSEQVRRFGEWGFPLVQFRGKPLGAQAQWVELRKALEESAQRGGWPLIVVNDRADLALLAAQAGLAPWGLHLGQEDLPPPAARILPELAQLHLGTSTHSPAEWNGVEDSCDHAGVGPYRGTASKPGHNPPIGPSGLEAGCRSLRARGITPIAIGGLTAGDLRDGFRAGAESLAMIGELRRCPDPGGLLWRAQLERWRIRPPFAKGQGLLLAGSSGAGKSTLAQALAQRLGLPCLDLDDVIVDQAGASIPRIFESEGEAGFRARETEAALRCLASRAVVALGGGAWQSEALRRAAAASGFAALWIAETPMRCWARAGGDPDRPLAGAESTFYARHRARIGHWSALPCILPLGREPHALSEALASALD